MERKFTSARLKAYTKEFGIVKSKPITNPKEIHALITELHLVCTITAVFLTDGKTSRKINFTFKAFGKRPIFYTRSDGKRCHGLSVHPKNYPMTAHYADGSRYLIGLY